MSPTSDERREAAERLREIDEAWPTLVDDLEEDQLRFGALAMAGILACVDDRAVFRRLADLIDPTCEMVSSYEAWATCSACGAALVQPGYVTFEGGYVVLRDLAYCPACGARVIGRGVE